MSKNADGRPRSWRGLARSECQPPAAHPPLHAACNIQVHATEREPLSNPYRGPGLALSQHTRTLCVTDLTGIGSLPPPVSTHTHARTHVHARSMPGCTTRSRWFYMELNYRLSPSHKDVFTRPYITVPSRPRLSSGYISIQPATSRRDIFIGWLLPGHGSNLAQYRDQFQSKERGYFGPTIYKAVPGLSNRTVVV